MEGHQDIRRRTTRSNFGVPPSRYLDTQAGINQQLGVSSAGQRQGAFSANQQQGAFSISQQQGAVSTSQQQGAFSASHRPPGRSASRCSSASGKSTRSILRQEVELEADAALAEIHSRVSKKEVELKKAGREVSSIKTSMERLEHDATKDEDTIRLLAEELTNKLHEAEDTFDILKIELADLVAQQGLLKRKKNLDINKLDSDDDFSEVDEDNNQDRVHEFNEQPNVGEHLKKPEAHRAGVENNPSGGQIANGLQFASGSQAGNSLLFSRGSHAASGLQNLRGGQTANGLQFANGSQAGNGLQYSSGKLTANGFQNSSREPISKGFLNSSGARNLSFQNVGGNLNPNVVKNSTSLHLLSKVQSQMDTPLARGGNDCVGKKLFIPSTTQAATENQNLNFNFQAYHQSQNRKFSSPPPTESYMGSSDEDEEPKKQRSSELTMQDLVTVLAQFGNSQRGSGQVVMKTTVDKDLPKFGGEPEEWIQFKAEFERTTAKYNFDDSENLQRLRKALTGEAKTTVKHLLANVKNVKIIMEALEKRFGRPRVVLNSLATKVKSCGNVSTGKPESIITFGLAVQALVSNVVAYGEDGYINSVELLDTLVKKLAPDLATRWFEWLAADKTRKENLEGFNEWSSLQLDIAYQRADFKQEDSSDEKKDKRRRRGPGSINAVAADGIKCSSCGKGNHSLDKCWSFKKKKLDDRWKIVKSSKACISCLGSGHRANECEQAKPCEEEGCNRRHHPLLHSNIKKEKSADKEAVVDKLELVPNHGENLFQGNYAVITGCDGPLPIVPVVLRGPKGTVKCHALLDCGASRSLIQKDLALKLGLEGAKLQYTYRGINGEPVTEKDASILDCGISGIEPNSKIWKLSSAVTVKSIDMNPYSMDIKEIKRKWPHLKDVAASNLNKVVPSVIVGNNNPRLILARRLLLGGDEEPVGWKTELGWAISGNFDGHGSSSINAMFGKQAITNDFLHNLIKQYFSLEDFGVKSLTRKGKNLDEKRAYELLEQTTKKTEEGFETGLLWREDEINFPESETAALRRLEYTERKLKTPADKNLYNSKIEEYIQKKYARKLTPAEAAHRSGKTYYIPHFRVTNPNKPGKFRLVLDAKAEANGTSLNAKLLKGPDLIRSLVGVLWNFRRHRVALTGDIADMFHRVKIRDEDLDSQRFLWRNCETSREPDHYQMLVMIFGATSSPASAIFVKNKNAGTFAERYPHAVEVVNDDFYVDDCLTGGDTIEDVIELRRQLTEINSAGNFNVCKWMSNSTDVLKSIPVELCAEGAKNLSNKEESQGERVLGMLWNPYDDVFQFQLGLHKVKKRVLDGEIPTKREMCGLIMSLFDPVGFISHYKIKGLILLQDVWRSKVDWDEEITMETYDKWRIWLACLPNVKEVKIPRCYSSNLYHADNLQLHTFVDASSEAYSAVCYLRIVTNDKVEVAFVGAKARVAPLKKSTIPKLELQAALMGTRLAASFLEETKLPLTKRYFWSDSSTVLQWLKSRSGNLREFVANRIGEIQESSNLSEWNWIPTALNIADMATRFEGDITLNPQSEWYQGPAFLKEESSCWNFFEKRKGKEEALIALTTNISVGSSGVSPSTSEGCGLELGRNVVFAKGTTPDPTRFSSYTRLVRAVAATRKAASHWISKRRKEDKEPPLKIISTHRRGKVTRSNFCLPFTSVELLEAEKILWRRAQEDCYSEDLQTLRNGGQLKRHGKLRKLSPILDEDGIMRVDGRIAAANNVDFDVKFSVILPPRHHVTELIIDEEHVNCMHQGKETVNANLRQKFWIVDSKHAVNRSWTRCWVCKLAKCKPVIPRMGNLPSFRLESYQLPFRYCGLDLFGPMVVTVGRRHEKRWGVLFCCMVTRGVHLEVVYSLSTDDVLMALSRFVDSRGRPYHIHSDNGTNFVGAARELKEGWAAIDFVNIQQHGRFQQIRWTFNPPAAPHMGGVWERLVQSVKKCLRPILFEKYPKDSTLLTALKSVENVVNSRPLTAVSCDPSDPEAITPNHFLRGGCDAGPAIPITVDVEAKFLRTQWERSQVLAEQFWKRWTREYLPKLVKREKWLEETVPIQVGALVFVVDDNLPRNCWIRGFISAVYPGEDGGVRRVDIMTGRRDPGTKKRKIYKRGVAQVCPLGLTMKTKDPESP